MLYFMQIDDYLSDSSFLFDNLEGGAWRQGWDIKYNDGQWNDEPLNVFVVRKHSDDLWWYELNAGLVHALAQRSGLAEDIRRLFSATNKGHTWYHREYSL